MNSVRLFLRKHLFVEAQDPFLVFKIVVAIYSLLGVVAIFYMIAGILFNIYCIYGNIVLYSLAGFIMFVNVLYNWIKIE